MIVLIIVICFKKNREVFLGCIPTMMLISVLVIAPHHVAYYFWGEKLQHYILLIKLNQMCSMIYHWMFSTQYIKTSMIFPLIFTMTDLEITMDRSSDRSTNHEIDTSRIDSKLHSHGFSEVNKNQIDVLISCELAIKKCANKVKKVTLYTRIVNIVAITIFVTLSLFQARS